MVIMSLLKSKSLVGLKVCFHNQIQCANCDFPTIPISTLCSNHTRTVYYWTWDIILCLHVFVLAVFSVWTGTVAVPVDCFSLCHSNNLLERKLRRCDLWLTSEHNLGNWRSLISSPVLGKINSAYCFHSGNLFQGHRLRKAICYWD